MANVTIATTEIFDGSDLLTSSQDSSFLETNLNDIQPTVKWRTTTASTVNLTTDLGSANAINQVALIAHNGTSTATWQVRGASDFFDLTSSPSYDSGAVSMWANGKPAPDPYSISVHTISSVQSLQWWRIDVFDASNPDGYFEAGRCIIDEAFQPTVNVQYGWSLEYIDPSPRDFTIGGGIVTKPRQQRRKLNLLLDFFNQDEMYNNVQEILRKRGRTKDVLIVRDPDATAHLHRQTVYGLLSEDAPIVNTAFEIFSAPLVIEELV